MVLKFSQQKRGTNWDIFNSTNKNLNQHRSAMQLATLLYSASVEDRETIFCFLAAHDNKFGPVNTQKLVVDFLSRINEAQSASLKAWSEKSVKDFNCKS